MASSQCLYNLIAHYPSPDHFKILHYIEVYCNACQKTFKCLKKSHLENVDMFLPRYMKKGSVEKENFFKICVGHF